MDWKGASEIQAGAQHDLDLLMAEEERTRSQIRNSSGDPAGPADGLHVGGKKGEEESTMPASVFLLKTAINGLSCL